MKAYAIDPHDPDGAVWTAIGWNFAGHPHRARPIFEKLKSVDPHFDYLLFGLCWDAYFAGDFARAEDFAEQGHTGLARASRDPDGDGAGDRVPRERSSAPFGSSTSTRRRRGHTRCSRSPTSSSIALRGEGAAADALATEAWVETIWSDFQYTHIMAQAQARPGTATTRPCGGCNRRPPRG
jgi:hypothetical protein